MGKLIDEYQTVMSEYETEIKVKSSRFIALLFPTRDDNSFDAILRRERKKTFDATHHCYAYRWGLSGEGRFSDDGEPSGTAGRPIQAALVSKGVTNAGIIVTRYFGGTKLGTGGLVRAYREAADAVLNQASFVKEWIMQALQIELEYPEVSIVMQLLENEGGTVTHSEYTDSVRMTLEIRQSRIEEFQRSLIDRSRGNIRILDP